jgi:hypothetical protein
MQVSQTLGCVQGNGHPDEPGELLLLPLDELLQTSTIDVLEKKIDNIFWEN